MRARCPGKADGFRSANARSKVNQVSNEREGVVSEETARKKKICFGTRLRRRNIAFVHERRSNMFDCRAAVSEMTYETTHLALPSNIDITLEFANTFGRWAATPIQRNVDDDPESARQVIQRAQILLDHAGRAGRRAELDAIRLALSTDIEKARARSLRWRRRRR